jgi:hypothetical protein
MFFGDFKKHKNATLRKSLLWEYDASRIDWQSMRSLVVQRVVERGRIDDFHAILNLYGLSGVKEAIRQIAYLNPKDRVFVCKIFNLKKEELKCYSYQQLKRQHWIS